MQSRQTRAALDAPALGDPGEQWLHGTSLDHVGLMVEAASGMRLGDYLRPPRAGDTGAGP